MHRMSIKKYIFFVLILLLCPLRVYTNTTHHLFDTSNKPPDGFSNLIKPQLIVVDVYYQNTFLGVAQATVSANDLRFEYPSKILSMLKGKVQHEDMLKRALTKKLPTNTNQLCDIIRHSDCNSLLPNIISIIYDPNTFKVILFINPRFQRTLSLTGIKFLPASSSGFSYINQLYGVSNSVTGEEGYSYYNLTSNDMLAYKNARLNVSSSYANNLVGNTAIQINEANAVLVNKQYQYTVGMLDTFGNAFFSNNTILGGQWKTTLDTMPGASAGMGVPITLSLNSPSQVSVYKEGTLIYTARYQAGNQLLDTSRFPNGSYPIIIQITGSDGSSREINQFFVKTSKIAPLHLPQYYINAGYLMADRQFDSGLFTQLLSIPVAQTGVRMRLSSKWGLNIDFLGTDKNLFSSVGVIYLHQHWNIEPAVLVGMKGEKGYAGIINYKRGGFSIYARLAQLWFNETLQQHYIPSSPDYYYRFLNLNKLQFNCNINYQRNKTNISFFATVNQTYNQSKTYAYGPSFTTELFRHGNVIFNFNLSAAQSDHDRFILGSIRMHFISQPMTGYGSIRYSQTRQGDTGVIQNGLIADAGLNWNHMDTTQRGYTMGVSMNTAPTGNSMDATYQYQNNRTKINTFGRYNTSNENNSFIQYGGAFNTHLIYTAHNLTISGGDIDSNSGVLVQVKSLHKHDKFDVYVNQRLAKHLHAFEKAFIALPTFDTSHISVANTSEALYDFNHPEHIVTTYPGNVQKLTWTAQQKYIVLGRLITPQKKPIQYAVITGGVGYNTTDEAGYFQLERTMHRIRFNVVGTSPCQFILPIVHNRSDVRYIGDVMCYPIQRK
jgi:hypothetical protein